MSPPLPSAPGHGFHAHTRRVTSTTGLVEADEDGPLGRRVGDHRMGSKGSRGCPRFMCRRTGGSFGGRGDSYPGQRVGVFGEPCLPYLCGLVDIAVHGAPDASFGTGVGRSFSVHRAGFGDGTSVHGGVHPFRPIGETQLQRRGVVCVPAVPGGSEPVSSVRGGRVVGEMGQRVAATVTCTTCR